MKMRTVWNWRNLQKTAAASIGASAAWAAIAYRLDIDPTCAALFGVVVGVVSAQICLAIWPGWDFEWH